MLPRKECAAEFLRLDIGQKFMPNKFLLYTHSSITIMRSSMPRRSFITSGALAIGALCTPFTFAGTTPPAVGSAQRTVFGFIGKYSDNFFVCGGSGGATRLVALVLDFPRFSETLSRTKAAGISHLRVAGTLATFRAGGQLFELENLVQQDFTARLRDQAWNRTAQS